MSSTYIKQFLLTLLFTFSCIKHSQSQCVVCVDAPPLITCGETATLSGDGYITSLYSDDFNTGIGPVWSSVSTGGVTNSTCTSGPNLTLACSGITPGGDFLWFPQGSSVPRRASTVPIPVPTGGTILFEFKMEQQSGSCDGPDLIGEGIMLQYNTGTGWTDIPTTQFPFNQNPMPYTNKAYFCPTNPQLQTFTSWNQYQIPIPAAAYSANTSFRWIQTNPTSAQWDFWGLDNVNIIPTNAAGPSYSWNPGGNTQVINVSPTSTTNYTFTYSDGVTSCSTTVALQVAPPVVTPSIVPNPLNPCPSSQDLTADVGFNSCNYNVYLYDNGGDGWITVPQTPTSIDNRLEVYVDGVLANTITLLNGNGPVIYSFPVTPGGTFETVFLSGGPNPNECAYFVEDNQGNLLSAQGLITSPGSPWWPVPSSFSFPSNGFTIIPGNVGPLTTACPSPTPYNYSWSITPGGSTAGITSPNNQNTVVTTAGTQTYQVVATDAANPGCIGTGTVQVLGSGGNWNFDPIAPNPACEGDCIDLNFTSSVGTGNFIIGIEMIDANGTNNYNYTIDAAGNNIVTGLPISLCPTISAGIPNATFNITSFIDAADPNNCEIPITNQNQVVSFSTQPNAGANNQFPYCGNSTQIIDLSTYLGVADANGSWTGPLGALPAPPAGTASFMFDPQIDPPGVYTYTVNNAPCAQSTASITANMTTPPNAGIAPVGGATYCTNDPQIDLFSLLVGADPTGTWNPLGSGASFNFNPSTDPSGVYTYTVTDPSSVCPDESSTINITVNSLPTATIGVSSDPICEGQCIDLIFNLTGSAPFNLTYSDPTPVPVTLNANGNDIFNNPINICPPSSTIFSIVSITDNNGCTSLGNSNIPITVNTAPNAGSPVTLNICSNSTGLFALQNQLTGSPDLTGYWTTPAGPLPPNPNFDFNPQSMPQGNYTYTVSAFPCPDAVATVPVNLINPPFSGIANPQQICINDYDAISPFDLANLLTAEDAGGVWCVGNSGGAPIAPTIDPNTYGTGTTTFTYEVFGTPPCTPASTTVNLTINPEPVVNYFSANPTIISQGTNTTLTVDMSVGTPPITINIQDNDIPTNNLAIVANPTQQGSTVHAPNVIPVTTYSITQIQDANGCQTTAFPASVNVDVEPYPIIDPFTLLTPNICVGDAGFFELTLTQGEAPVTVDYTYNGNNYTVVVGSIGQACPITQSFPIDVSTLNIGINTLSITSIIDNSGKPSPLNLYPPSVDITLNPTPVVSLTTSTPEPCFGDPAILDFGFLVGTANFTVDYTINSIPQTPLVFTAAGVQSYNITPNPIVGLNTYEINSVTDVNGCVALNPTNSVDIIVDPVPDLNIVVSGTNPICVGQSSSLFFPVISGTPPYNLNFLAGTTPVNVMVDASGNVSGSTWPINPTSTTTYTLVDVTDAGGLFGCTKNFNGKSATLDVNELPFVNLNGTTEICEGEVTQLYFDFSSGVSPWTVYYDIDGIPTNVTLSNPNDSLAVSPSNTAVYTINSISDPNCSTSITDAATITVNPLPETTISGGGSICNDGSTTDVLISTSAGTPTFNVIYSVGLENRLASNIGFNHIISTNEAGIYTINEVTDSKGCKAQNISGSATVTVNPMPEANFTAYPQPADISNPLIYFIDQSTGHSSGNWDFGDNSGLTPTNFDKLSHMYSDQDSGTYIVQLEIMTDSGCSVITTQTIIIDEVFNLYIPNAFTPNNDLDNDYFLPIAAGITEYELSIFNRYGQRVFRTDKFTNEYCINGCEEAWDGKVEGKDEYATSGHYAYAIVVTDINGKKRSFEGTITLIR